MGTPGKFLFQGFSFYQLITRILGIATNHFPKSLKKELALNSPKGFEMSIRETAIENTVLFTYTKIYN